MLRTFFENEIAADGTEIDNSRYFKGKKIMGTGGQYTSHMGKYPVIFLSMKSAKQPDFGMAYESLVDEIIKEYDRHRYLLNGDINQSDDNLWNFLFFTGYLKAVDRTFRSDVIYIRMKIPNREIRYIYNNTIQEWFRQKTNAMDFSRLYNAILSGDTKTMSEFLKKQLCESISFMDSAGKFYHGFLPGMLSGLQGYKKKSNQ